MGLSSQLASSNVLDYWSQELLEDGGLQIPTPMSQARNDKNSNREGSGAGGGGGGGEINDQAGSSQIRKHWPPLRCPRCDSTNTKFCYYNNYSKSQPRHFCKACRRHWTEGGTLRNVPVGGGRKNKRAKNGAPGSSNAAASTTTNGSPDGSSASMIPVLPPPPPPPQPPQQNKLSGLNLFGADHMSSIFPEVLRQVFLHPPPPPQLQLSGNYNAIPGNSFSSGLHGSVIGFPPDLVMSSQSYVSGDAVAAASGAWTQAGRPTTPASASDGGAGSVLERTRGPYWSGWDDDMTNFDATRASSDAP